MDDHPHTTNIPACDDCGADVTEAQCRGSQQRTGEIRCAGCEGCVRETPNHLTIELRFDAEAWAALTEGQRAEWIDDVVAAVNAEALVTAVRHSTRS